MLHRASRFYNIVQKVGLKVHQPIFTDENIYCLSVGLKAPIWLAVKTRVTNFSHLLHEYSHVFIVFASSGRGVRFESFSYHVVKKKSKDTDIYLLKMSIIRAFNLGKDGDFCSISRNFFFASGITIATGKEEST